MTVPAQSPPSNDVTDLALAAEGVRRIEWAEREMPVLRLIRERFERERPLDGLRIGGLPPRHDRDREPHAHAQGRRRAGRPVGVEPAVDQGRRRRGARRRVRDPDVRAARRGPRHVLRATSTRSPTRIRRSRWTTAATSSRCSTPSGPTRSPRSSPAPRRRRPASSASRRWRSAAHLRFPVIAVNEAQTKHLFDNRYGTGQSTVDGMLRATNILLAGRHVVIAGYGWVGAGSRRGCSGWARTWRSIEVDPVRALEALMDGFQVMTAGQARRWGDVFVTATGNINVFRREHFEAMRDGAMMANSGHFDAELDLPALREMAEGHVREVRENVQEFDVGGKRLNLIAEGRLVNLGAAEGHPAAVMDMSFANQALSAEYVAQHHAELEPQVYVVPEEIDAEVARLKLAALGIELDPMTPEQREYVASWQHGT